MPRMSVREFLAIPQGERPTMMDAKALWDRIGELEQTVAALRALVEAKDKALKRLTVYEGYSFDSGNGRKCSYCSGYVNYEHGDVGHYADCPIPAAKAALLLERLEEK